MSELMKIKGQVAQIAGDAKNTANALASFKSKFSQAISQVSATVGKSSVGIDREMIATLQQAEKQLDAAIGALLQVSQVATKYNSTY